MDIGHLRKEYRLQKLDKASLLQNPFKQFHKWFEEALTVQVVEPNAMALATTDKQGRPSCRTVLMKSFDENGFLFYTNLESRKAKDLSENPKVCAVFWWKELERQVILEGTTELLLQDDSAKYFSTRPRGSQLGAWASMQGQKVESRKILEQEFQRIEQKFLNQKVPLPPFWGGFRIKPTVVEFWQGRADRIHDRLVYKLENDWKIERLSP